MARPAGRFDAKRYFHGDGNLRFYNVGTKAVRGLAKAIYRAHRDEWSMVHAVRFANALIVDRHLERYLRRHGPWIPRTTVRYAIERMPEAKRKAMLQITYGR